MSTDAKRFKETLNLPTTRFDMKANLTVKEPLCQERWREMNLYGAIRQARARCGAAGAARRAALRQRRDPHGAPAEQGAQGRGRRGTSRCAGFDSPYVPGWDCHGLPIEHKVMKDLGPKVGAMSHAEIRGALPHRRAEVGGHPAQPVRAAGRDGRLGATLPDAEPELRGRHRRRAGRPGGRRATSTGSSSRSTGA